MSQLQKNDEVIIYNNNGMKHLKNIICKIVSINDNFAIIEVINNKGFTCRMKAEVFSEYYGRDDDRNKYKNVILSKISYEKNTLSGMQYKIIPESLALIKAVKYLKKEEKLWAYLTPETINHMYYTLINKEQ